MKQTILSVALLVAIQSFGQVQTISKIKSLGTVISELAYQVTNSDTVYTLAFKDATYQRINVSKVIAFRDLEGFRKSVYDCLQAKDRREITIGSTPAVIGYTRELGTDCIRFVAKDGFVVWTERQIGKLFL